MVSRRRRYVAFGRVQVLVAGGILLDQRLQQPSLAQQPRTAYAASHQQRGDERYPWPPYLQAASTPQWA